LTPDPDFENLSLRRGLQEVFMFRTLALLAITAIAAFSQATTATIQGVVHDPTGALVPGAAITITNIETQAVSKWVSGPEGTFTAPFLQPGEYEIAVEKSGFKRTLRRGITLLVADTTRIDIALEIGATSDTVTATAEAPLVKVDTSELGQVIQSKEIDELPLNSQTGRNFTSLMTLVPGAFRTNPVGLFDAPQGNSSFSVNGQRDGANNYMIDGADNNEVLLGIVTTLPPPEALGEFKLQTNAFSAEFGRAGGAVISVTTRSGTNEIHGSLYEFLRNSALDARGPFDRATLPPLRQNDFGATFGGPIRKNRTFLFADYSGFRQRAGQSLLVSVPTLNQRDGVFLASEGSGTIYDPNTGSPFPNNTIPTNRINSVGQKLLNLYPAPSVPGRAVAGTGVSSNYNGVVVQQQDVSRGDARIDHTISSRNNFYGRYSIFNAFTALPPVFGPQATGDSPSRAGKGDSRNQSMVVGDVHIFSGTAINEARMSYARIANSFVGYDYGTDAASAIGIPNINVFGATSSGLPRIDISGLNSLGVDAPIPALRYENSFQWVDNFTLIRGKHNLKFGADIHRFRGDFFQISLESPRGHFSFDQNYTSNNGAAGTGLAPASVLLGYPATEARGVIYMFPSNRIFQSFFYFQDDFKVSRKLTLNLGIRYELYPPPVDRWDNQANFNLATGQMMLANRGGNSRALVNTDKNNFAPRFGFAYALQPRTAIRGGYGISYYPDKFGATGGTLNNSYPFISLQQITPADRFKPDPTLAIDRGIPIPVQPALNTASVPLVGSATYFDPNYRIGYIQFWNFTIQHQFTKNMSLETAYVGTRGTHLFGNNHVNINQPDPGPGNITTRRPYYALAPLATSIPLRDSSEWSIYHALQVKLQKRTANGLWLLGTYTWAKALDDQATSFSTKVWDAVTRGPAASDFRHNITVSAVYELPFGKGRKFGSGMNRIEDAVLGGWQINGINTFRTGLPSTATLAAGLVSSTVNTGGSSRPDQVASAELPSDQRSLAQYFNTAAFVAPATNSFRFGNAGRDTIRGPSLEVLDFSLFKNFKIREQMKLQFRGEFFNVLNHPNYGQPGTSLGSATFGAITSLAANTTMRQSQLGLKLLF
jgi:Carboxypeptidase regulatory-like domain